MITIKLYKFDKKINSTKIPNSNEGTSFSCLVKTNSSIINPVLDIKALNTDNIVNYNYAYIPSFNRYYFINDIVYDMGIWTLYLSSDVLASFRTDILYSNQYVLRSSSLIDGDIIDTAYISKVADYNSKTSVSYYQGATISGILNPDAVRYRILNSSTTGYTSNYFNVNLSQGEFVVGIVGSNATGTNYYVFSYNGFRDLIRKVCALQPSDMTDVSTGVANALYNPMQYITSCKWYPQVNSINVSDATRTLVIGSQSINLSYDCFPLVITKIPSYYIEIDIPKHPDSTNYPYTNLSPYTELNLFIQPFGNIPIDTTKVYGETKLYITWDVDYSTGLAHLKVHPYTASTQSDSIIVDTISSYGVDIPISALIVDWKTGALLSGLTWVGNTIGDKVDSFVGWASDKLSDLGIDGLKMTDNTNLIDKAKDVIGSALGQVNTKGSLGSFLAYNSGVPYLYAYFYKQVEHDNNRYGSPCYKNAQLINLSGYCLCSNANVNFNSNYPVATEKTAVNTLLNTGVYLE